MPRSPIPNLIELFHQLDPTEQKCFLELVDPQVEEAETEQPKPASKKAAKKIAKGGCLHCDFHKAYFNHTDSQAPNYHAYKPKRGASRQFGSIAETIAKGLEERRKKDSGFCVYVPDDGPYAGRECAAVKTAVIHDKTMGYAGYHEFVGKSDAANVRERSSTNGGERSSKGDAPISSDDRSHTRTVVIDQT